MTTIRTILIDPFARTITEHQLAQGLAAIYAALSGPGFPTADEFPLDPKQWDGLEREPMDVDCIDIRSLGGRQDLVVDDIGRIRGPNACFCFMGGEPLAGRALIYSHNDEGEAIGTTLPLALVEERLDWLPWDTDLTPPPPMVVGFSSFEAMRCAAGATGPEEPRRTNRG